MSRAQPKLRPGGGGNQAHPSWILSAFLALGGGLAWAACFQEQPRSWLACFALAPLIVFIFRPVPLAWAWLFGTAHWFAAFPWLASTLITFGGLPASLAWVLVILLAGVFGLEAVVLVWAGRWFLARRSSSPNPDEPLADEAHLLWVLPAIWVLLEAQRGFFAGGFPWNLAAYAWSEIPGALVSTALLGARGLSFLVVLVNVALVLALHRRRWILGLASWASVVLLLLVVNAIAGRWDSPGMALGAPHEPLPSLSRGALSLGAEIEAGATSDRWEGNAVDSGRVRVIQPNSPIVFDDATLIESYRRLLRLSHEACDRPSLLIWPESAAWPYSWERAAVLQGDVQALVDKGCSVLVGSALYRDEGVLNAVFIVGPNPEARAGHGDAGSPGQGRRQSVPYAKRQLVPWGEYVPLKDLLPFVGKLARNAGDFVPGSSVGLLDWQDNRLAAAICYEVIFPSSVAEQVTAGASTLVTVTNDAWYGDSSAPWQHLMAARFRAAETRRPLLRSALTGVSAVVDRQGKVVAELGVGETGILSLRLEGAARPEGTESRLTPFVLAPHWPVIVSLILVAFVIIRTSRGRQSTDLVRAGPSPASGSGGSPEHDSP